MGKTYSFRGNDKSAARDKALRFYTRAARYKRHIELSRPIASREGYIALCTVCGTPLPALDALALEIANEVETS